MKRWSSFIVWVMVAASLVVALIPDQAARAQNGGGRRIEVPGVMVGSRLSPDGALLLVFENSVVHEDEVLADFLPLRLIDLATGAITLLTGHTDYASDAVFTPDSAQLVSYHPNGELIVWDVAALAPVRRIAVPPVGARLAMLPDGGSVMVSWSGTTTGYGQWDLTTGQMRQYLRPAYTTFGEYRALFTATPPDREVFFDMSPDGAQMIAASLYGHISRWDVAAGTVTQVVDSGETMPRVDVQMIGYVLDGTAAAYYHRKNATLAVIDPANGAELRAISVDSRYTPVLSADRTRAAWVNEDGVIRVVDLADGAILAEVPMPASALNFRPLPMTGGLHLPPGNAQIVVAGYYAEDIGTNEVWVLDLP